MLGSHRGFDALRASHAERRRKQVEVRWQGPDAIERFFDRHPAIGGILSLAVIAFLVCSWGAGSWSGGAHLLFEITATVIVLIVAGIWRILPYIGIALLVWGLMKLFAGMIADEISKRR
jgi:hypothetical protein